MLVTLIVNSLPGEWLGYSDNHLPNSSSFSYYDFWNLASDYATGTRLRGGKQTVLGYISKLLYIRCRWDLSTARPGRKLLMKQREVGGAASDIVSWTFRMGGGEG